ncbi:MAG: hypothetical protein LBR43_03075 [Spiroplasmataceae bacterium]|jgi:hypothetical protein|nr:hypothetical protein [Spiroplasmataceae bacterium]
MVNENLIPRTEIVQELKSEMPSIIGDKIPSYEEFLKNYENDASLNYSDLSDYNIATTKGYGPTNDSANVTKWCSHCSKNVTVSSSSTKCCSDCGNYFGTVAKSSDINKQIDINRKQVSEYGGTYEYWEEEGTKPDGTDYTRRGTSYTTPRK